jgi:hypothetical protein
MLARTRRRPLGWPVAENKINALMLFLELGSKCTGKSCLADALWAEDLDNHVRAP